MANAVFNSFEDYLSKDTFNKVAHNNFDMSFITNFTTCYGALIPHYLQDCLPGDNWRLHNLVKVQALPMSNPVFNNIRVYTWYFFVPYSMLWHKFEKVMKGGRDGTFTAQFPYVLFGAPYGSGLRNSIFDYFNLPVGPEAFINPLSPSLLRVSAFPFAAYERVYRDFFLDEDTQISSNSNPWFPDDDDEFSLRDGQCIGMGRTSSYFVPGSSTDPLGTGTSHQNGGYFTPANNDDLDSYGTHTSNLDVCCSLPYFGFIRFKNWRKDYFTSAMFSPQRGPAVTVPSFNNLLNDGTTGVSYRIGANYDSSTGHYNLGIVDSSGTVINGNSAAMSYVSGFNISQIMIASQIQLWYERNMQVRISSWSDFLRVHFGDAPMDGRLSKPAYLGGSVQSVNVTQILQTSESNTTPQGTATGHANTMDKQYIGSYHVSEFGLIIGLLSIIPDCYYVNGVDKSIWIKDSKFDFHFPEFAQLPPEPIYNYEIYGDSLNLIGKSIFGYSGRCDNMRHRRSISVGDLRNPNMLDFYSWNITREFGSTPTLNSNVFVSTCTKLGTRVLPPVDSSNNVLSTVRADHFPVGWSQNQFIVQCGFDCRMSRPLPFRNVPQTLNLRVN